MEEGKVFHDLSKNLPEEERKQLLDRIKTSIQLEDEDSQEKNENQQIGTEEKKILIAKDISREKGFFRFLVWLISKITGKKEEDIYIAKKLKKIRKTIRKINPEIQGLESKSLSSECAMEFFKLYVTVVPLKKVFQRLWLNMEIFERGILQILEKELQTPKRNLTELVSMDELEEIYMENGSKLALREAIKKRIDKYIGDIPDSIYKTIEEGILPVYYIKEVVLFPFLSFFKFFQFTPIEGEYTEKPYFKNASSYMVMDYLKRMYAAVKIAGKMPSQIILHDDFVTYLAQLRRIEEKEEVGEDIISTVEKEKDQIIKDFTNLVNAIKVLTKRVPILEIIQFYLQDPYYSINYKMPRLYIKEFYLSVLHIKFMDEIEVLFPEIQRLYIEKKIKQLFNGRTLTGFLNYREYTSIDYRKLGLPFFIHTKSLNLLYNYIKMYYKENVQDVVRILTRGILSQNRGVMDRLLIHCAGMEDLEEKILAFDYSLSPDAEDGKLFQRLRFSIASDPSQQKIYRTLVLQKEKDVKELLDKGSESINGLIKMFQEILTLPGKTSQLQLANHYLVKGKAVTLREIVRERISHISDFKNIYDLVIRIERG